MSVLVCEAANTESQCLILQGVIAEDALPFRCPVIPDSAQQDMKLLR